MATSFFKVVLFSNDQGLKLPIAFMKKYGNQLQKTVFLKVPNGASWQVKLVHSDNRTWLREGWQEFSDYYLIKKFYFLVFRYVGNSLFHVQIFKPSALEIEYSFEACKSSKRKRHQTDPVDKDLQDDVSIEILEDDLPGTRRQRMTRSSGRTMAKSKQNKNTMKLEKLDEVESSGCSEKDIQKKQGREERSGIHPQSKYSNNQLLCYKEKFISFQKAKSFRSTKPFFISFMQQSYVSRYFILFIPMWFVNNYLAYKSGHHYLVLRVPELQQTWQVTCTVSCRTYQDRAKICSGWRKFVEENCLKTNDVCVFELESGSNIFNVIIYRDTRATGRQLDS